MKRLTKLDRFQCINYMRSRHAPLADPVTGAIYPRSLAYDCADHFGLYEDPLSLTPHPALFDIAKTVIAEGETAE